MLNDEICKLRDKLNKSIEEGQDYTIIYKLSKELKKLITKYNKKTKKKNRSWRVIDKEENKK